MKRVGQSGKCWRFDYDLSGNLVGYAEFYTPHVGRNVRLQFVFVDEKHRNQGIATRMYKAISLELDQVGLLLEASDYLSPVTSRIWSKVIKNVSGRDS